MSGPKRKIAIAGASSGLGFALAEIYTHLGYDVFGCGRRSLAGQIRFRYSEIDVANSERVERWLRKIEPVDVVFDCVGVLLARKPFEAYTHSEIDLALDLNLRAKALLLQKALRSLRAAGHGLFVSFASNPDGFPLGGLSLYAVCKAAHETLVRSVASEMPDGIVVVSIYPGMVDTPMLRESLGEDASKYMSANDWAAANAEKLLRIDRKHAGAHIGIDAL